jgi:integrase
MDPSVGRQVAYTTSSSGMSEASDVPTSARSWRTAVKEYHDERENETITHRHVRELGRVLTRIGEALDRRGLATTPEAFGEAQFYALLNEEWVGLSHRTRSYNLCLLNGFLKSRNNLTVEKHPQHFPVEKTRPTQAFTEEEADRLLTVARNRGVISHAAIALELTMGFRRSEVLRVLPGDFGRLKPGFAHFLGKGRGGGKYRDVPISRRVRDLLPELLAHRGTVIEGRNAPGNLFLHDWNGLVRPYCSATYDRYYVMPVFVEAGLVGQWNLNHALRRTFGRTLYRRGVPIADIAKLLGHEDIRTTVKYLGIGDDDMREAMDKIDEAFA